ncbi:MAG: hypothetical protein ACTSRK_19980 [Promethearchaeota archaeon]
MRKIIFKFLLIWCILFGSIGLTNSSAEKYFTREFEWNFGGYTWQWELSVPKSRYDQYSSIQVNERFIYGANNFDYLVTTEDPFIRDMAIALRNSSNQMGYSQSDEIGFILAFVQSLPYTSDNITTGYDEFPRFPLETLIDGGGDCEDSSILFATLVIILGYDAIFINPPNHLAVGVVVENVEGSYIEYNNKQYFYCETTISGVEHWGSP